MKKTASRWLAAGALVVIAGFPGLNALAYSHADAMLRFSDGGPRTTTPEQLGFLSRMKLLFAGVNIPRPASHRRPSELASDCRVLSLPGPRGITLASWYGDRGRETPLIILFHGYAAEKTSLLGEARAFLDLGTSVLLVDFRGSGGSSESYTTVGVHEAEDAAAAVRYARRRLSHRNVFLFGRSMGAAAILRAVHAHAIQPDGMILEAVFDTLLNTVRHRFRAMQVPAFPRRHGLAVARHEVEPPDLVFPAAGFEIAFQKGVKEGTLGSQSPQQPDEKAAQTGRIKLPKRPDVRLQAGQSALDGALQRVCIDRDRGPTGALEGSPDSAAETEFVHHLPVHAPLDPMFYQVGPVRQRTLVAQLLPVPEPLQVGARKVATNASSPSFSLQQRAKFSATRKSSAVAQ